MSLDNRRAAKHCAYDKIQYLDEADVNTFKVLNENFAKDKSHVWYEETLIEGADAPSFHLSKNGLPKDKYHIFKFNPDHWTYVIFACDANVRTADYFIKGSNTEDWDSYDDEWIRDSKNIYYKGQRVKVDYNTFNALDNTCWFIDKEYIYYINTYGEHYEIYKLDKVDILQVKPEQLIHDDWGIYLINGNNVIYQGNVIIRTKGIKQYSFDNGYIIINGKKYDIDGKEP